MIFQDCNLGSKDSTAIELVIASRPSQSKDLENIMIPEIIEFYQQETEKICRSEREVYS